MMNRLLIVLLTGMAMLCPTLMALTVADVNAAKRDFDTQVTILNGAGKTPEERLAAIDAMQLIIKELKQQRAAGAKGPVLVALNAFDFTPTGGTRVTFSKKTADPFQDIINSLAATQKTMLTLQKVAKARTKLRTKALRTKIEELFTEQQEKSETIKTLQERRLEHIRESETSATEKDLLKRQSDELSRTNNELVTAIQEAKNQTTIAEAAIGAAKADAEAKVLSDTRGAQELLEKLDKQIMQLQATLAQAVAKKGAASAAGGAPSESDIARAAEAAATHIEPESPTSPVTPVTTPSSSGSSPSTPTSEVFFSPQTSPTTPPAGPMAAIFSEGPGSDVAREQGRADIPAVPGAYLEPIVPYQDMTLAQLQETADLFSKKLKLTPLLEELRHTDPVSAKKIQAASDALTDISTKGSISAPHLEQLRVADKTAIAGAPQPRAIGGEITAAKFDDLLKKLKLPKSEFRHNFGQTLNLISAVALNQGVVLQFAASKRAQGAIAAPPVPTPGAAVPPASPATPKPTEGPAAREVATAQPIPQPTAAPAVTPTPRTAEEAQVETAAAPAAASATPVAGDETAQRLAARELKAAEITLRDYSEAGPDALPTSAGDTLELLVGKRSYSGGDLGYSGKFTAESPEGKAFYATTQIATALAEIAENKPFDESAYVARVAKPYRGIVLAGNPDSISTKISIALQSAPVASAVKNKDILKAALTVIDEYRKNPLTFSQAELRANLKTPAHNAATTMLDVSDKTLDTQFSETTVYKKLKSIPTSPPEQLAIKAVVDTLKAISQSDGSAAVSTKNYSESVYDKFIYGGRFAFTDYTPNEAADRILTAIPEGTAIKNKVTPAALETGITIIERYKKIK